METQKNFYDRENLKQYFAAKTWISIDGLHVERDYFDKDSNQMKTYEPIIHESFDGRRSIWLRNFGEIPIDLMVISCYGPPKPNDGKTYVIHHKDGNLRNNNASNLEWVEKAPDLVKQQKEEAVKEWYRARHIRVTKKGVIKQGRETLTPCDSFFDGDLDWTYHCTEPWVRYSYRNAWGRGQEGKKKVDEIMADFGFVEGDKDSFADPVVLHKNNDYLDFTPGNLEWCEKSDQRYVDYMKAAHDKKMKRDHDANHYLSPGSWNVVYRGMEPYQDWSDRPERRYIIR